MNKIFIISILALVFIQAISCAQESALLQGKVTDNDINIRSDSTTSAQLICRVNKGESVEVVLTLYDWYKIRLPKNAPSFIKKEFASIGDDKNARVTKNNVNIRLAADISSPILGKANKDELIKILEEKDDWYSIEPVENSYGWIHKNFVTKLAKTVKKPKEETTKNVITVEGIIKTKTFTRVASHKLITKDGKAYLLKDDIEHLNSFNNRRVKITASIIDPTMQKYPILKVEKIEALN